MKLLFLFGAGAVGKMTVGQELAKITELRLFYNHMTIEPIMELFGETKWETVYRLRDVVFEDFSASDCYGMIFTYMMAFDRPSEWEYIEHVAEIFRKHNAEIYYAELHTSLEVRLQRNVTENRLKHKPSKRNIERSNHFVQTCEWRCVSNEGEIPFENYIKIDNTEIPSETAARMIKERFIL